VAKAGVASTTPAMPQKKPPNHSARNTNMGFDLAPGGRRARANVIEQVFVRFRLLRHCYSSAVAGANNLNHFDTLR
jgi:hypothetical protein